MGLPLPPERDEAADPVVMEARALEWLANFDAIDAKLDAAEPSQAVWSRLEASISAAEPCSAWRIVHPGVEVKNLRPASIGSEQTLAVRLWPGAEVPSDYATAFTDVMVLEGEVDIDGRRMRAGDLPLAVRGAPLRSLRSAGGSILYARCIGQHLGAPS